MNWNIGYNNAVPNVLSELTWKDVKSYGSVTGLEYICKSGWCKRMVFMGGAYANLAYDGRVRDSDYSGNNRTGEFSRSYSHGDDSSFNGGYVSVGYDVAAFWPNAPFSLTPRIGYALNKQTFKAVDGVQAVSDGVIQTIPVGTPLTGLNSTYEAKWRGPSANIDFRLALFKQHEIRAGVGYVKSDYRGIGTWNLRSDFQQPKSFEQNANGSGKNFAAGYSFWLTPRCELRLDAKYETWEADNGTDTTYFSDNTVAVTPFKDVTLKERTYTVGVGYKF